MSDEAQRLMALEWKRRAERAETSNAGLLEALRIATRGRMDYSPGNAPGHAHQRPGVWDDDNVRSGLAGKPCEWCTVEWPKVVSALNAAALEPLSAPAIEYMPPVDPYTAVAREFHQRMGLTVRDAPSLGTPDEREERVRLMLEELLEVAEKLGVEVSDARTGYRIGCVADLSFSDDGAADVASVLHELADLQVTVSGTAVQFGLPLLAAVRGMHRANMEKTPAGPGRKPLKPAGWRPADVSGFVADRSTCLTSDECGVLCQERCTVKDSVALGAVSAAPQEAPGAVLRQLAGADPTQPASSVLPDNAPSGCACADPDCGGCYYDGWSGGVP